MGIALDAMGRHGTGHRTGMEWAQDRQGISMCKKAKFIVVLSGGLRVA